MLGMLPLGLFYNFLKLFFIVI
jgi:transformation/transcription domain-associated protein